MTWRQQAGNFDSPINPEYEQEARLVDQARAGSERAFSALLARYQQPVFRLIFYLVGDADEARELSRIALKHALTRMPRVPAGYSVRPWLLRVATLVALDSVRERSESPQALIASLQLPPAPQPTTRIIDADPTLSETMELSITKLEKNPELEVADAWDRLPIDVERELVRRLLASLPENDAELLALGVVGQVPTRDLAAISGTSQRSIRRRIARALILFQSHYQMIRQEALPPPPPTRELEPGNISAVMAIHVARRGLNEATERMRRSWHNVRASLGSVEAQESLQTLRDEDVPAATATPSRPLTAPAAPPSTSRVRPSPITRVAPPPPPTTPEKPPRLAVTDAQTIILPPAAPPARPSAPSSPVTGAAPEEKSAPLADLASAMPGKSNAIPPTPETEPPVGFTVAAVAATTIAAGTAQPESGEEPTSSTPPRDDAPEQRPTAIRQLPRFGPPAEAAAAAALTDDVLADEAARPVDEDAGAVAPENAPRDEHAILLPPAHTDEPDGTASFSASDEAATFADARVAVALGDTAEGGPDNAAIAAADQGQTETDAVSERMAAAAAVAAESEAAYVAPEAPLAAETTLVGAEEPSFETPDNADVAMNVAPALADDTAIIDPAGMSADLTAAPTKSRDAVARATEESLSAGLPSTADEDGASAVAAAADPASAAPIAAEPTLDDATDTAAVAASPDDGATPASATGTTHAETATATTDMPDADDALTAAKTMPKAAADAPTYVMRQEDRTMPVSRHFGDTVVVRDDARLDYVARHQGNTIDLSDLSGIIGAAFSEQPDAPEELPPPAQPPSAGVLHIMPESATTDDGLFVSLTQSNSDATIVAKPIAQPAREEVTALTEPADLADLAGILTQMTQIRYQPTDAMPQSPETRPRRVTRPMPRLERDAPEPPNDEP